MERLQKVIAHAGVASRRKAEELIQQGKVTVNGKTVTELGIKVSSSDVVEVEGIPLDKEHPVYYLLNKPRNTISAASDDKGRPVVTDYFTDVKERIYPIGRLDYDTTGLLLLTNDGELANLLMHPKFEIDKKYVAKVAGIPTKEQLLKLESGIRIDGRKTSRAKARLLSQNPQRQTAMVELTIHEGWNHQVKKMFEAIGCPVQKLKREQYAFLTLDNLQPGMYRELKAFEVEKLRSLATEKKRTKK